MLYILQSRCISIPSQENGWCSVRTVTEVTETATAHATKGVELAKLGRFTGTSPEIVHIHQPATVFVQLQDFTSDFPDDGHASNKTCMTSTWRCLQMPNCDTEAASVAPMLFSTGTGNTLNILEPSTYLKPSLLGLSFNFKSRFWTPIFSRLFL